MTWCNICNKDIEEGPGNVAHFLNHIEMQLFGIETTLYKIEGHLAEMELK